LRQRGSAISLGVRGIERSSSLSMANRGPWRQQALSPSARECLAYTTIPSVPHAALFLESLDFSCPLAAIYENTHLARACGN
jgi:hypothetical protein